MSKFNMWVGNKVKVLVHTSTFFCNQESEKKENECVKNAQDFRDKYKSLSNQLGIEGKNIKNELADLLCSLPEMYKDVAQQGRKTKEAAGRCNP